MKKEYETKTNPNRYKEIQISEVGEPIKNKLEHVVSQETIKTLIIRQKNRELKN